ncbi:MAG: PilZ domain-containing protein [Acidobacteriia bacterium]|nr:PilZ domain-containing protein [Terriglobia bacterium]
MDRRQNPRVTALLPVRIWGVDAYAQPFMQLASMKNISRSGASLQGICRQVRPGQVLEVQLDQQKAEFRVLWVGKIGSSSQGEIGLERVASEPCIWDMNLENCSQFVGMG